MKQGRPGEPPRIYICTYCGSKIKRYATNQVNPKTGLERKIVKCPDCRRADPETLFNSHVDKTTSQNGCWLWTGTTSKEKSGSEHGVFRSVAFPHEQYAHRFAYIFKYGGIPNGVLVLHKCPYRHNPLCVNPAHLALGTHAQNMIDMVEQGRQWESRRYGEKHYARKLNDAAVDKILREYRRFRVKDLANELGVSIACVRDVWQRRSWKHVPAPLPPEDYCI